MAVELAQGYISMIPQMQGAKAALTAQLVPASTSAGATAGTAGGTAMGLSMRTALLKFLGPAALVAGIVVAFKGLYSVGDTWNDVTNTIRVGTGASGDALDDLVQSAKNVGNQTPAEIAKVSQVIADLNTTLGYTGSDLETVSRQILEAGRIMGTELNIQDVSSTLKGFNIEAGQAEDALDNIFRVSQATGVGMNELTGLLRTNGGVLQTLGFSLDSSANLIGVLSKSGVNANTVIKSMSAGLVNLAKDGEEPAAAFDRVVGEIGAFLEAGDEASAITRAGEIFGTRGAPQLVAALKDGTVNLKDLTAAAGLTEDTILGLGQETMTNAEQWQILKNNASAALEPLGSSIFQGLQGALAGMMPYLTTFAGWLGDNLWAIGAFASVIGVTLVAAFVAWTVSVWASTVALLANPMTWIVLAVIALIAAIVLLVMNWDTVVAAFADGWEWVKNAFSVGWEWVKGVVSTMWEGIKSYFNDGVARVKAVIQAVWDFIKLAWSYSPLGIIVTNWDKITGAFKSGVDKVKGWLQTAWDFIKTVWSYSPIGMIVENWDKIMDFFKGLPSKVRDVFNKVKDGIVNALKAAFNSVSSLWNNSLGKIEFEIPDWIPGVGGNAWAFPKMPMLAKGGWVTGPTLAMVGEGIHPEVVAPLPDFLDMVDQAGASRDSIARIAPEDIRTLGDYIIRNGLNAANSRIDRLGDDYQLANRMGVA